MSHGTSNSQSSNWHLLICSICLDETKNDANEKYAKFEQLKLDAKSLEIQWHLSTSKWFEKKGTSVFPWIVVAAFIT